MSYNGRARLTFSINEGARANGDPLKDIAVLQDSKNIQTVIKDGLTLVKDGKKLW